jgi:hypothetical protein
MLHSSAKNLNRGYHTEAFLNVQDLGASAKLFLTITGSVCLCIQVRTGEEEAQLGRR